jgi:hypothetical protein
MKNHDSSGQVMKIGKPSYDGNTTVDYSHPDPQSSRVISTTN